MHQLTCADPSLARSQMGHSLILLDVSVIQYGQTSASNTPDTCDSDVGYDVKCETLVPRRDVLKRRGRKASTATGAPEGEATTKGTRYPLFASNTPQQRL